MPDSNLNSIAGLDSLLPLLENSPVAVYLATLSGKIVFANATAVKMLGYSREEFYEMNVLNLDVTYQNHQEILAIWLQLPLNTPSNIFGTHKSKDGKEIPVEIYHSKIQIGDEIYVLGNVIDISEALATKNKLDETYHMLKKLLEQVPGVVYQYRLYPDGHSCFPFASEGMYDIYEYHPHELTEDASLVFNRLHPEDIDRVSNEIFESARNQTIFHSVFKVILPTKGLRWCRCDARPQLMEDGSTLWYGIITDITTSIENLEKIENLLKAEEEHNKRLRNFTHIVSHNLRSHTANMEGLLKLLKIESPEVFEHPYLKMVMKSSENLNETITHLNHVLDVNLVKEEEWVEVNLNDIVTSAVNSTCALANNAKVNIKLDLTPGLKIKAVPAFLESITLNMITNAIKFCDARKDSYLRIYAQDNYKYLHLCFEDNGIGIDLEKYGEKIFGMYKTIHLRADSKGLGLFMAKQQAEAMGGSIMVESKLNVGTTFKLILPYEKH
jgi:PAS domain S-box-containing protein